VGPNPPAPDSTIQYPPDPSHWIQVDPIRNFKFDPGRDSATLLLNITGTTNLPVNSLLFIEPYQKNFNSLTDERALIWNVVVPVVNTGEQINSFSYSLNGDAGPGEYRVVVRHAGISGSTNFTVMGKDPFPWLWIRIDPIGEHRFGESFNITGTTNIPVGSEVTVRGGTVIHPCVFIPPEKQSLYPDSICGSCPPPVFNEPIPVTMGVGNNTWTFPVNTTGWCKNESYNIELSKNEWDNVSPISAPIPIRTG
jgi:hypothetical protein